MQVVDVNGNMFGDGSLEVTTSNGKPKVPVINTDITIGTTAIVSGTVGRVLFQGAGNVVQQSANLFWDNTNGRLGIGTSTPLAVGHFQGSITASGAIARNALINGTLTAAANNDVLVGLDIAPTFTNGAFTGTARIGARIQNSRLLITGTYNSLSSEAINPDSLIQLDATINGRAGSRAIAFRINPTINVNNVTNQVFAALEVNPTYQNVGVGSSALAINSSGPNVFGTINTFGAQTIFLGQGGTSTYHYVGTIPNGQGFRVQVNSNIAGYSYNFDGSGIPTYTLRNNNIDALQVRSTGNVLINTTTDAGFKLDVNGTARISDNFTVAKTTAAALSVSLSSLVAQNSFFSVLNGTDGLQLTSRGSGTTGNMGLPANSAEILCYNKAALGLILHTTSYLAIGAHTAERMRLIASTGNLLIGTTTDAGFRLDVNGTARATQITATTTGGSFNIGSVNVVDFGDGLRIGYSSTVSKISLFTNSGTQGLQVNNGSVSIGPQLTPNASAILDLTSTTKGFLLPRMTTTQRNAIASPAGGLMVFDTTLNVIMYYNGTMWI